MSIKRFLLSGYVLAVFATGVILYTLLLLQPLFGGFVPIIPFFLGIVLAAWRGGLRAGLVATALSTLASVYFFMEPFRAVAPYDQIRAGSLLGGGALFSLMISQLLKAERRAFRKALEREEQLKREITERKQAEEALNERTELLECILAATDNPIFIKDAAGRFLICNEALLHLFNFQSEDIIGRTVFEVYPPDIAQQLWDNDLHLLAKGGTERFEETIQLPNGELRFYLTTKCVYQDAGGRAAGIVGVATDITERKRADEAIQRLNRDLWKKVAELETLLDVAPIGLAIAKDPECRRIRLNATFAQLLGVPPEINASLSSPSEERPPWTVVREGQEVPPEERPMQKAAAGYPVLGEDIDLRLNTGKSFKLLSYASPLFDVQGKVRGAIGAFLDVTEQRRLEEELAWRAARLEEVDRRKNEFLAMLGHELRNPLAPIRNAVQIMKVLELSDPKLRWAREVIDRQTSHLTRLVDDLLDISRIVQGKLILKKAPVELTGVIGQAIEATQLAIDFHQHTLAVFVPLEPLQLEGDGVRLTQVVTNLLDNAAKYTPKGGQIWLTLAREHSEAVISVRDTGEGISASLLPHLFEVFTQAERTLDRSQGGLGLGLTIVRTIVELHGGWVEARSDGLEKGSEFIVRLPVLEREPAQSFAA